jgi:hypothetical protein
MLFIKKALLYLTEGLFVFNQTLTFYFDFLLPYKIVQHMHIIVQVIETIFMSE